MWVKGKVVVKGDSIYDVMVGLRAVADALSVEGDIDFGEKREIRTPGDVKVVVTLTEES